jgi:hypothetical protein
MAQNRCKLGSVQVTTGPNELPQSQPAPPPGMSMTVPGGNVFTTRIEVAAAGPRLLTCTVKTTCSKPTAGPTPWLMKIERSASAASASAGPTNDETKEATKTAKSVAIPSRSHS